MQSAVAQKPAHEKDSDSQSKSIKERIRDSGHDFETEIGLPIFLKSASTSGPSISSEDDEFEREADRVADAVAQDSDSTDSKQTPEAILKRPSSKYETSESVIESNDPGSALHYETRHRIESRTGEDLSHVRVHEDIGAKRANKNLNSRAFAQGSNICLGAGESQSDIKLMAHEATHVVQQGKSNSTPKIQRQQHAQEAAEELELEPISEEVTESQAQVNEPQSLPDDETLNPEISDQSEDESSEAENTEPAQGANGVDAQGEEAETEAEELVAEEVEAVEAADEGGDNSDGEGEGEGQSTGSPGDAAQEMPPAAGDDSLSGLQTGEIALIDTELAEHQRWGAALEIVGTAQSLERAEFVAEAAGGGLLGGLASGAAMGLGMGLVGRAAARFIPIPGVGGILSGAMTVFGPSRDWSATGVTFSNFGEGASTYETLANSIAAIAEIIDIVSTVLSVVEGIVGILQIAVYAITAAAGIATVLTLGAAGPVLAAALTAAETLTTIALALAVVTTALDLINAGILQPSVLLFRALHAFTSEADPREVEAQGADIGTAAGAIGGAVGGAIGARGAAVGGRPRTSAGDAPTTRPHADTPVPAAGGNGPSVRVEMPRIDTDGPSVRVEAPRVDTDVDAPTTATGASRPAIRPPANPDAPVPDIPAAPRVPEIAPPDHGPAPDHRPAVDPLAPTIPAVDPNAPTLPAVGLVGSTRRLPATDSSIPATSSDMPGVTASRQAIRPPANPDAPVPDIPAAPRVPEIAPPDYAPAPGQRPAVDPLAPTIPVVDPNAPTLPAVGPTGTTGRPPAMDSSVPGASSDTPVSTTQSHVAEPIVPMPIIPVGDSPVASSSASSNRAPIPSDEGTIRPTEVAPANASSAWLRRLRAEADGLPVPTEPGMDVYNIARHQVPGGRSSRSTSPYRDLYQSSPRPAGTQSHHPEQQAQLGRTIEGYRRGEDPTIELPTSDHYTTYAPQRRQRDRGQAYREGQGTSAAHEENFLINRAAGVSEAQAGQVQMEHAAYLFELTPLTDRSPTGTQGRPHEAVNIDQLLSQRGFSETPDARSIDEQFDASWDASFSQSTSSPSRGLAGSVSSAEHSSSSNSSDMPEAIVPIPIIAVGDTPTATSPASASDVSSSGGGTTIPPRGGDTGGTGSGGGDGSGPLFPNLTDAEFGAVFDQWRLGSIFHAPAPTGFRTGKGQEGYWGTEPDTGMTIQEYRFLARRGLPQLDNAGNPLLTPHGDVQTRMRIHSRDMTAPPGSPSHEGWTVGVEQSGKKRRMTDNGEWFDTRFDTTAEGGQGADLRPYRRAADGSWIEESSGAPVADPATISALEQWDSNMEASHIPLTPPEPTAPPTPQGSGGDGPMGAPIVPTPTISVGDPTSAETTAPLAPDSDMSASTSTDSTPTLTSTPEANTRPAQSEQQLTTDHTPETTESTNSTTPSDSLSSPISAGQTLKIAGGAGRQGRINEANRNQEQGQEQEEQQATQTAPQQPGLATQLGQLFVPQAFSPEGDAPTQQQREDAHRGRFAEDAQAGNTNVERVNPDYPPPPGTPQQLEAIQQEIENILAARAQAEQAEAEMESQEEILEADQTPIQQAIDGADGGITAVQAHQEAVTRRGQMNQEQQQRQQETGGLVSGYPSRAAGLATLTIPLDIFAGFTSLGSHLPGDAGAKMAEMNQDAVEIQNAFTQMGVAMLSQEEAQPERQADLSGQQSRIEATDAEAMVTNQSMEQSRQDGQNLQQENEAQLASANQAKSEASDQEQTLEEAAATKQAQAGSLTEQLQAWAVAHKAARHEAVEATAAQLEADGYVVLEKNEG